MIQMVKDLRGSKTFWACVAGLAGVAQQWSSGGLTNQQAGFGALALVIAMCQRHATEKATADAPPPKE